MNLASRVQLGDESSSVFVDDGTFMVSRMLTIFNVADEDAGNFVCEASSMIPELALPPSDSSVFELVVLSKHLHFGTYTCVASNAAANVTQNFDLVVQGEEILYLACTCSYV